MDLTKAEQYVLDAARATPGVRLVDLPLSGPYRYGTLRTAAASLRRRGLLHPAKPAVVSASVPAGSVTLAASEAAALFYVTSHNRAVPQADVIAHLRATGQTPHQAVTLIKNLRKRGILRPWDGLVPMETP